MKILAHSKRGQFDIEWDAVEEIKDILNSYTKEYPQYTALQIADIVIEYCLERNIPLNYLKLHTVLSFLQVFYYAEFNQKLFKDEIYVYGYGLAIPIISETYGYNGNSSIRKRQKQMSPEMQMWLNGEVNIDIEKDWMKL